MSDHEEAVPDTGYDTPVPELDDHRHQQASTQRSERPRRGTFDSLYGARHLEPDLLPLSIRIHDFEESAVDEEGYDVQPLPLPQHGRRGTVESSGGDRRSPSPPNSVKAFAQARRRERQASVSEVKVDHDDGPGRAMSISSRRSRKSLRSRSRAEDNEGVSCVVDDPAEEDVCFPVKENPRKDRLCIDFEYLDTLVNAERAARDQRSPDDGRSEGFEDLRKASADAHHCQLATIDGDIFDMPSEGTTSYEKNSSAEASQQPKAQPSAMDGNRFSFFSSAWESTIHAAEFGDLVLPGEDVRGLFELPKDEVDGVWWLNINGATKDEVYGICKAFGVHPLTIEDIATQEAREKIELFPSYYFACFRSFNVVEEPDGKEYEPFNIYVLVFREGTLSFSFAPNKHASDVRKRITSLKDYVSLSSDWICYALVDNIVDSFAPVISQIEVEADAIEDEVFIMRQDDSNSFLRSIGRVRKNCMALLRLLGGKADVLRGFTKRCNENYQVTPHMDIGIYLGDIQDHVVTMATNLGHFEKILSRAHSNYLATLSINNVSQGTKTNEMLSKVTFLASIVVPLNFICSVFGMNIKVPFVGLDSLAPFFTVLGCMAFLCLSMLGWARWKRYI